MLNTSLSIFNILRLDILVGNCAAEEITLKKHVFFFIIDVATNSAAN